MPHQDNTFYTKYKEKLASFKEKLKTNNQAMKSSYTREKIE